MIKFILLLSFYFGSQNINSQVIQIHLTNWEIAQYNISEILTTGYGTNYFEINMNDGTGHKWYNSAIKYINYLETGSADLTENEANRIKDLKIFPNPSNGKQLSIQFETQNSGSLIWEITDITGKQLYTSRLTNFESGSILIEWIPEINLNSGIYYCRLNTSDISISKSFVIQQ